MATMNNPVTPSLTDELRTLIRAHRPELSTGAYGDEGEILMAIETYLVDLLHSAPMAHLKMVCPTVVTDDGDLKALLNATETFLANWKPLRLSLSLEAVQGLKEDLHQALRVEETRTGQSLHFLREQILQALDSRGLVYLERGDDAWQILHRLQFLHLLGYFLVEREAQA